MLVYRTQTAVETFYLCRGVIAPDCRIVLLSGSGLGHSGFGHHGRIHLPDGQLVHACHRREALAQLATDDRNNLVVCRWLLRALLVFR